MSYILITGAGGFIGGNLLEYIHKNHSNHIDSIVLLSGSPLHHHLVIPSNNYQFTTDDFVKRGITSIETVIHLGAYTPKDHQGSNLVEENSKNITNTLHLLSNLPAKPNKFIFISTTDVYPRCKEMIDESIQTSPFSFYGECKLFCEKMMSTYCTANNIILQVLRLGNIYGKRESGYKKLIPETIRHILRNEQPVVLGPGEEKRSFLNVHDCVKAIWRSLELSESVGPINIVSSSSEKIKDVVEKLIGISGKELDINYKNIQTESYDTIYDNKKMLTLLGDETVSLQNGLTEEYIYEKQNFK